MRIGYFCRVGLILFLVLFINQMSFASVHADFYATPQYGEPPLQVQFTNTTEAWQDSIITWIWDFGDGTTSNEHAPSHLYENPGAYTVKLTAIGINGGVDAEEKPYYIRVLKADFTASPATEGYGPLTVTFMGQPLGYAPELGDELFWDFGDGQTESGTFQPTHTYSSYGYFDVTFKIINNGTVLEEELKPNYIHVKLKTNNPPFFLDVSRTPECPKSDEPEKFFAIVDDSDGVVVGVLLIYSDESGSFRRKGMELVRDHYEAIVPPNRDGTFVQYFFQAMDDDSLFTIYPDTSKRMLFYTVRDSGLSIRDLQYTPFESDISGYEGLEITVKGIVTCSPQDYPSFLFIQEGPVGDPDPWTGIMVRASSDSIQLGDIIEVTGTVEEIDRQTAITNITKLVVTGSVSIDPVPSPHPVPIKPINTGVIGIDPVPSPQMSHNTAPKLCLGSERESWEGMLLLLEDVTVTDAFPDTLGKPGDFIVDDGSGPAIIGSHSGFAGNKDSTFQQGDHIAIIVGILVCEDDYFKIMPRNQMDIITEPTTIKYQNFEKPTSYRLYQNFPNPFNPITEIQYQIPKESRIKIDIYNIQGQKIFTLVNALQSPGKYSVIWNGRDFQNNLQPSGIYFLKMEAGAFCTTRKLTLLR